jgi:hypothetical protein
MHKLREFWGCDFSKIRPFFDVFSSISPLGNTPKMTSRKSGLASEFLENFIEKRRHFSRKNTVFGKSRPTLPEKGENFLLQIFAFLKNRGIFSDFEFLKQPHYWTILKNTRKISICDFLRKNGDGQKKANFTFFKKRVFSQKRFLRFFTLEGLCQNEKIGSKNALSAI